MVTFAFLRNQSLVSFLGQVLIRETRNLVKGEMYANQNYNAIFVAYYGVSKKRFSFFASSLGDV